MISITAGCNYTYHHTRNLASSNGVGGIDHRYWNFNLQNSQNRGVKLVWTSPLYSYTTLTHYHPNILFAPIQLNSKIKLFFSRKKFWRGILPPCPSPRYVYTYRWVLKPRPVFIGQWKFFLRCYDMWRTKLHIITKTFYIWKPAKDKRFLILLIHSN